MTFSPAKSGGCPISKLAQTVALTIALAVRATKGNDAAKTRLISYASASHVRAPIGATILGLLVYLFPISDSITLRVWSQDIIPSRIAPRSSTSGRSVDGLNVLYVLADVPLRPAGRTGSNQPRIVAPPATTDSSADWFPIPYPGVPGSTVPRDGADGSPTRLLSSRRVRSMRATPPLHSRHSRSHRRKTRYNGRSRHTRVSRQARHLVSLHLVPRGTKGQAS